MFEDQQGRETTRPSLTLSGKVCEIIGFLAGGLGFQLQHRGLLLLGLILFLPVILAFALTWVQLRFARIRVIRPEKTRAWDPTPVEVEVTGRFPIMSLLIQDPSQKHGAVFRLDDLRAGQPSKAQGYEILRRRGRTRPPRIVVSCDQPLGLCRAERRGESRSEILVWPAIGRVRGRLASLGGARRPGERRSRKRGIGGEFSHLRSFSPGDSSRFIHWAASAKMGELMVREWEEEREGTLLLSFGWQEKPRQAHFVEHLISLVSTLIHRSQREILLLIPQRGLLEVAPDSAISKEAADDALALLPDVPGLPQWSLIDELGPVDAFFLHPGCEPAPKLPGSVVLLDVDEAIDRGEFYPRGTRSS